MANVFNRVIVQDGWRNASVRLSGILDTANENQAAAVALANFTNNDTSRQTFKGFRINQIEYSIADQLQIQLYWVATTPQLIVALAGRGEKEMEFEGGLIPDKAAAGFTGAISMVSTGWASGTQNYTISLNMVKLYS